MQLGFFYRKEYDVCMKNTLPRLHVGLLTTTNPDWSFQGQIDSIEFERDNEFKQQASYKSVCHGDSGAGKWVTIDEKGSSTSKKSDGRSALVAIARGNAGKKFKVKGEYMQAVCGSNMILDNGDLLTDRGVAIRATHPVILGFIKKYAKIVKSRN